MQRCNNSRSQQKLVIFVVASIIIAILGINIVFMMQGSTNDRYLIQLQEISDQSKTITQNYADSIGEWKNGLLDNAKMLQITDNNLEQLQSSLSRLKGLDPPKEFTEAHEMSILSLEYELESNKHMRKYVETGDQVEYEKSSEDFQHAFDYESKAFEAFAKANKTT